MRPFRENLALSDLSGTRVYRAATRKGTRYRFHSHPEFELALVETAQGDCCIADDILRFEPGEVVAIDANVNHTFVFERSKALVSVIGFQFSPAAMDSLDSAVWNPAERRRASGVIFRSADCQDLIEPFREGLRFWRPKETAAQGLGVRAALFRILSALSTLRARAVVPLPARPSVPPGAQQVLNRVLSFINNGRDSPIALTDAARVAGMRPEPFCRFLKRHTGMTFTTCLNQVRLTHAARLLRTTDRGLLDVAAESGYANQSYFHRRFKVRYGMSPGKYRQKHSGNA